jgi:RNA polymerase sigma factor (sigma-70 family)
MLGRDPAGLEGAYRRYADELYTYARSLTGDRDAAIDIVHDTFLLATERVEQLRDPGRLRPWLYAIARSIGLRHLRRQARHAPLEAAGEVKADTVDLLRDVQAGGVADLVRSAMAGLSERDAEIVELAVRHRLAAPDVAAVLGLPLNHAHARLSRAREQLLVCLGVLLVARESRCAGLIPLLAGWDGTLNPLLRKRLHRHIDGCVACGSIRNARLDPAALLSAVASLPFLSVPTVLFGQSSPSAIPFLRDLPSPASPPAGPATGPPGSPASPAAPGGTSPSHGGPPASDGGAAHGLSPAMPGTPGTTPSHGGPPASDGGAAHGLSPAMPGTPGTTPSHGGPPPSHGGPAGGPSHDGSAATPDIRWGNDGFPAQPSRAGRKTMIAVAAGVAAAIVIAAGGIAATVHNGPFGSPGPVVSLDAVVLTESATPAVSTSSPAPPPPPPKSTGTPALAFTATGVAHCVSGTTYTLKVTVTANATLATATLHSPGPNPMSVSGKTAQVTVTGFGSGPVIAWHVDIRAADGRTLTGPNQGTANPC